jgi:8-oxo-dGTP diphosphatase
MAKPRILVTGFTAFSTHDGNISQSIMEEISNSGLDGLDVETMLLTVDEAGSKAVARELLAGAEYRAIIHLGFSDGSERIRLERYGRNENRMTVPDNSGRLVKRGEILNNAPERIQTNAPVHVLDEEFGNDVNVIWSEDAGGYVCNETYFRTLFASGISPGSIPTVLLLHLPDAKRIAPSEQLSVVKRVSKCLCMRPHYEVVAALLLDEMDRLLACRRPVGDAWAGWWEFPGGKISWHETPEEALSRELEEELQISINPLHKVTELRHQYGDRDVTLQIWHCGKVDPISIRPTEHDETRWLSREGLMEVKWLPADRALIESWHESGIPGC